MFHFIRSSTQLNKDMGHSLEGSRIEVMVWDCCSVGYVARSILRDIICNIRMVGDDSNH